MKRTLTSILLLIVFVVALPLSAYADSKTIQLDEPKMTLEIPGDFYVLGMDSSEKEALALLGYSQKEWHEIAETSNFYMNAFSEDFTKEIVINMTDSPLTNLSEMPDNTISGVLVPALEEVYTGLGYTINSVEIFKINGIKYIRIDSSGNATADRGIQYATIIEGNTINITYHNYTGNISSKELALIDDLMDSVSFGYESAAVSIRKTEPFVFRDEKTGTEFTVPANWEKKEFKAERQYLDAKFGSTDDENMILYSSQDGWDEFSESEKKHNKRSDMTLSTMPEKEVKEAAQEMVAAIGGKDAKYSRETIGGHEYYKIQYTMTNEDYGIKLVLDGTSFFTIENGYAYLFQFNGNEKSPHYQDMIKLLESIQYPAPETEAENSKEAGTGLIIVAAVILIGAIAFLLLKKKKVADAVASQPVKTTPDMPLPACFCTNCGNPLPQGSKFCPNCGTGVIER